MTETACVAVDWGTTSFRLWRLDAEGVVVGAHKSAEGMSKLSPDDYGPALERAIAASGPPTDAPAIVCGMAGAAQGWREAAYLDVPAGFDQLAGASISVDAPARDVRILPGLAQRRAAAPDVMRGEETLLMGLAHRGQLNDGVVCLPGTHTKWVDIESGAVAGFRTAMTGEVRQLLAESSTLRFFIEDDVDDGLTAFDAAVREAAAAPEALLAKLFSVRAGPLLFGGDVARSASQRLSGLLIGAEIGAMRGSSGAPITLAAGGAVGAAYARAFDLLEIPCDAVDSDALARDGLLLAARSLWPERFGG